MNSFKLIAVGNLARNPELTAKGDITFAKFCLVGEDEVSEQEQGGPRGVTTSLWFIAFGSIATDIANGVGKGDQLILEARIVPNHWTDKHGTRQHGHTFVVTGFRFGERSGPDGPPAAACRRPPPDEPLFDAALAAMEETV